MSLLFHSQTRPSSLYPFFATKLQTVEKVASKQNFRNQMGGITHTSIQHGFECFIDTAGQSCLCVACNCMDTKNKNLSQMKTSKCIVQLFWSTVSVLQHSENTQTFSLTAAYKKGIIWRLLLNCKIWNQPEPQQILGCHVRQHSTFPSTPNEGISSEKWHLIHPAELL